MLSRVFSRTSAIWVTTFLQHQLLVHYPHAISYVDPMAGTRAISRLGSRAVYLLWGFLGLLWLLNLVQGLVGLLWLLNLMQGIKGIISTMNCHGLMCANALVQAVLGIESNGVVFEINVRIMLSKLWQAQYH